MCIHFSIIVKCKALIDAPNMTALIDLHVLPRIYTANASVRTNTSLYVKTNGPKTTII